MKQNQTNSPNETNEQENKSEFECSHMNEIQFESTPNQFFSPNDISSTNNISSVPISKVHFYFPEDEIDLEFVLIEEKNEICHYSIFGAHSIMQKRK
jgi:hypothetical protein